MGPEHLQMPNKGNAWCLLLSSLCAPPSRVADANCAAARIAVVAQPPPLCGRDFGDLMPRTLGSPPL
jgi:hypothetical protein